VREEERPKAGRETKSTTYLQGYIEREKIFFPLMGKGGREGGRAAAAAIQVI